MDETRALAIRGIELLQDAIKREFGLTVKLGAELEFMAFDRKNHEKSDVLPLGEKDDPPALFAHSPFISSEYKEFGSNKYELVFHHESNHQALNSGVVLARAIEAAKKEMERNKPFVPDISQRVFKTLGKIGVINQSAISLKDGARIRRGLPEHDVEISLAPATLRPEYDEFVPVTCSLQINLSLWDQKGQKTLWKAKDAASHNIFESRGDDFFRYFAEAMLPVQAETLLLHMPYDKSYKRLEGTFTPNDFSVGTEDNHDNFSLRCRDMDHNTYRKRIEFGYSKRIENRLAGADADPYKVILATLAGAYHAMRQYHAVNRIEPLPDNLGPIPRTLGTARKTFEDGTLLRNLLNDISGPEELLGDHFCHAVLSERKTRSTSSHLGRG